MSKNSALQIFKLTIFIISFAAHDRPNPKNGKQNLKNSMFGQNFLFLGILGVVVLGLGNIKGRPISLV